MTYIDMTPNDDAASTREAYRDADRYMDDRPTASDVAAEERGW